MFYEAVFYTVIHINSIKPWSHHSRPNTRPLLLHNYAESHWLWFRNYQRAELLSWESRWGKEASLIEFYVAVVEDLNMPEFITHRIIMSYKNWQSQIGPPNSSKPQPTTTGMALSQPFSIWNVIALSLLFILENEIFVFDIEEKNQYEFINHTHCTLHYFVRNLFVHIYIYIWNNNINWTIINNIYSALNYLLNNFILH